MPGGRQGRRPGAAERVNWRIGFLSPSSPGACPPARAASGAPR